MSTKPKERLKVCYVCNGTEKDLYDVFINSGFFTSRTDAKKKYKGDIAIPTEVTRYVIGRKNNELILFGGYREQVGNEKGGKR